MVTEFAVPDVLNDDKDNARKVDFEYGINKSSNISLFISNLFLSLCRKTLLSLLKSILQGYCFFI